MTKILPLLTLGVWLLIAGVVPDLIAPAYSAEPAVTSEMAALVQEIDEQIRARIDAAGVTAAPSASDAALLRRVTLDLAGRIPTAAESAWLQEQSGSDWYAQAVQRLMDLPDYAYHLRNELDILLLARQRHDDKWREYLLWATRQNRPWNEMFTDIMLPPAEEGPTQHAAAFLRERVNESEKMANDTAVLLFGVNISCAQCHDHPLVADWEQKHFYGMLAFFNRTYKTKINRLAEKPSGIVKFKTVAGVEHEAPFMFLTGESVAEPPRELTKEQQQAEEEEVKQQMRDEKLAPPAEPAFSPRRQLVELALKSTAVEQNLLARAIVNRTWARLLGYGFVEPLDQMHSENPPSHPELLDRLTADFIEHGYNLKRLIQTIVLSEPYRRSSEWYRDDPLPAPEYFAVGQTRPLNPGQLAISLLIASTHPERFSAAVEPAQWEQRRDELERQSSRLTRMLVIPEEGFQVDVDEALFFNNSPIFQNDYLRDAGDKVVGYLKTLTPEQAVQQAYQLALTRSPEPEEQAYFVEYLARQEAGPIAARQNLLWALLTNPEFRFNH